jgi:hypothetical protein
MDPHIPDSDLLIAMKLPTTLKYVGQLIDLVKQEHVGLI